MIKDSAQSLMTIAVVILVLGACFTVIAFLTLLPSNSVLAGVALAGGALVTACTSFPMYCMGHLVHKVEDTCDLLDMLLKTNEMLLKTNEAILDELRKKEHLEPEKS